MSDAVHHAGGAPISVSQMTLTVTRLPINFSGNQGIGNERGIASLCGSRPVLTGSGTLLIIIPA